MFLKRWTVRIRVAVLGAYTYLTFLLSSLLFMPLVGWVALRTRGDPTCRLRGRMMRRYGRFNSLVTPIWKFSVSGTPPPDIGTEPYVVVSNHESTADPFLLSYLPWDMRWIAKDELFRVPIVGPLMQLGGDIRLRRGERDSVKQMFEECRKTLAGKLSVMIFPEGTRSPDGNLLPFKDGAFQLAIEAQVPILPVCVAGTRQCRPKGSIWFGNARAKARILEVVSTAGMTLADLPRLKETVRARIFEAALALRAELGLPQSGIAPELEPAKGGAVPST